MSTIKVHQVKIAEQQLELQCRIVVEFPLSDDAALDKLKSIEGLTITHNGLKK